MNRILKDFSPKATNNKNRRIMKKKYFAPEMEIVLLENHQTLLAGSLDINNTDASVTGDFYDDAPGFNLENELFGFGF